MTILTEKRDVSFFEIALGDHLSTYPSVPSFFLEDSELIEIILGEGIASNTTNAIEVLERCYSFGIRNITDEWYCTYEPAHGLWLFNRVLTPREIDSRNEAEASTTRHRLRKHIFNLTPREFEYLIYELFRASPHYEDPIVRPMSHDGGYEMDVRFTDPITNTRDRILIQAKHVKKAIPVSYTRELIGTLAVESNRGRSKRLRGLMISLYPPSPCSEAAADNSPHSIDFLSADDIVELMIRNGIGCRKGDDSPPTVDATFWEDLGGRI